MSENFQAFLKLDKSNLINQYVVIVNKKVIATGMDIENMLKKAKKKYPSKIPFVAKVPEKHVLVL